MDIHTIQQSNGYKCGLNVLLNAKLVLNCYCIPRVYLLFNEWFHPVIISVQSPTNGVGIVALDQTASHSVYRNSKHSHLKLKRTDGGNWEVVKLWKPFSAPKSLSPSHSNIVTTGNRYSPLMVLQ